MAEASATFSESWYRIAGKCVYLRPGVRVQRQNYRGERWIVLQNPFSNQYFRLRPAAYEFVARLAPDKSVQQAWQECVNRFPDEAPGQESVIQLLSQLYYANLLHYPDAEDSAQLFERNKRRHQREMSSRLMNLMFLRFPLLDPDRFLVATLPVVGKFISKIGAVIWMIVVGAAIKVVIDNFAAVKLQGQGILAPSNLFLLYVALVGIKTIHEFGHAYFCRKFGGEVHVMGVLLMIFTPVPYMDASSSWGLRNRLHRMLVGGAGMIVEVFVAALATFVWARTGQGALHSLAYNVMFIASVSTVIFNANPLLRFDGYYILSDLLEIPNLSQRATAQLRHLWEHNVFGVKQSEGPATRRSEATWLVVFGITSGIYRVVVFAGVLLLVADRFLLLGLIMAAVCAISWVTVPVGKFMHYLASSPRLERVRTRSVATTCALAGFALVLLAVVPFPCHFRAPGVVQAERRTEVATAVAGVIVKVIAEPGTKVTAGQPLVQLTSKQLELDFADTRARLAETEARMRAALTRTNADLKPLASSLQSINNRLAKLQADEAALTVRAPHDGLWVAPRAKDFAGRKVERGLALGMVVDPRAFEFVATVSQADADVFARQPSRGEVRLRGQAGDVIAVSKWNIVPGGQQTLPSPALGWVAGGEVPVVQNDPNKAKELFFEVHAKISKPGAATLLHGRSGSIRFDLEPQPLLPRWFRRLGQLLQQRYQV